MSNRLQIIEVQIEVATNQLTSQPASQSIAAVYLVGLAEGSRRTMLGA